MNNEVEDTAMKQLGNITKVTHEQHSETHQFKKQSIDVLERIENIGLTCTNSVIGKTISLSDLAELIKLAKLGQQMQWIEGKPPVFGVNERKWIIFEHLSPFTKATVYDTAVWLGKFYSEEKVKLALRWMLLPLPSASKGENI